MWQIENCVAGTHAGGYVPSVYKKEIGSAAQRVHLTPVDSTLSSELQNWMLSICLYQNDHVLK